MSDLVGNPNCWFSHAIAHLEDSADVLCPTQKLRSYEARPFFKFTSNQ